MKLSRRTFLKGSVAAGALVAVGAGVGEAVKRQAPPRPPAPAWLNGLPLPVPVETDPQVTIIPSVCGMCPAGCSLRARIWQGFVVKLDGNPYSPTAVEHPLPDSVSPLQARSYGGSLCAKGQAGRQQLYADQLVTGPLKRVGPRGSGRWRQVSWAEAIRDIVEGGNLFGEGEVQGLRSLRDLSTPIDPGAPELGPRVNQVLFFSRPEVGGRAEFIERFARDGYGTINVTVPRTFFPEERRLPLELTFPGGGDFAPDLRDAELIVYFGAAPLETGALPVVSRRLLTRMFPSGGGSEVLQGFPGAKDPSGLSVRPTLVVVDPRFSQSAAKADLWLPIRPGGDAALAYGIARYLLDHRLYDASFLSTPSSSGGVASDAAYLVNTATGELLRASDLGLGAPDDYVVSVGGVPTAASSVGTADLEWSGPAGGVMAETVFSRLARHLRQRTVEEWAAEAGLPSDKVVTLAEAFGKHGRRSVADFGSGLTAQPDGLAAARAVLLLNILVGNLSVPGGYGPSAGFDYRGESPGAPYPWASLHPGRLTPTGVRIDRAGFPYEKTTEYARSGYPSRRPWLPLAQASAVEFFAGIAEGYPYPAKALLINGANPVYELPGGPTTVAAALRDTAKVPLLVVIDRAMSETAALADYILPDVSYLEQYGFAQVPAALRSKGTGFRQPVKAHRVYPRTKSLEEILILLAKRLGLPGFGTGGLGSAGDLNQPWDYYQVLAANMAQGLPGTDPVAHLRSRGGRWEEGLVTYRGTARIYPPELTTAVDSTTGKPAAVWASAPQKDGLRLVTYQLPFQYRGETIQDPYLVEPWPKNLLLVNPDDARRYGLKSRDLVRLSAEGGHLTVTVQVLPGLRPGVVALSQHFGHWAYGSKEIRIQGQASEKPAAYRAAGVLPQRVMPLHADPITGLSIRQGLTVTLERA